MSVLNINHNESESKDQNSQILCALKKGERITHLDALHRFNCARLSARIYDLKQRGFDIGSERIKVPSGKWVKEYFLVGL